MSKLPSRLRRFTSLPAALDMLLRRRVSLVNFSSWLDVNDRKGMEEYQHHMSYPFVGAMCLTTAKETSHHWQVFTSGDSGVCISFEPRRFLAMFSNAGQFLTGNVEYVPLEKIGSVDASDINRLPFLKRRGFIDECEYRVVGFSASEKQIMHVPLDPLAVQWIRISPFVPTSLLESCREVIQSIDGWGELPVRHSRLTDSQQWQRAIRGYTKRHGTIYGDVVSSPISLDPGRQE